MQIHTQKNVYQWSDYSEFKFMNYYVYTIVSSKCLKYQFQVSAQFKIGVLLSIIYDLRTSISGFRFFLTMHFHTNETIIASFRFCIASMRKYKLILQKF